VRGHQRGHAGLLRAFWTTILLLMTGFPALAGDADQQAEDVVDEKTADEKTADERALVLDEIVVTAQRREQNLQKVPVAVTAFQGEDLEQANITDAAGLLTLAPNVSFTEDGQVGRRGISLSVRGVGDLKTGENSAINSIGVYLDDFSVVSVASGTINPQLQDLERVEVLRGPQGTYFGRNAVGGALNLRTRKPTPERSGSLSFGGDLYDTRGGMASVSGVFNVPLSESFLLRGVGSFESSSGRVRNIQDGATPDSGHDFVNLRLSARWLADEKTTLDFMVMHTDDQQGTDENVPSGVWDIDTIDTFGLGVEGSLTEPVDPGTGFWPENRERLSHDLDEHNTNRLTLAVLNLDHQFGEASTFRLVTGVIRTEHERFFDNDLVGGADLAPRQVAADAVSWSIEARFERQGERVDQVVGVLYARDDHQQQSRIRVGTSADTPINGVVLLPPASVFPPGLCLQCADKEFEVESAALFADFTVHLSERLDLILGGRYTHDEVSTALLRATSLVPGTPFTNTLRPDAANEEAFDDVSPRLGLWFQARESVGVYALASKGYKGGGTSLGHDTNTEGEPALIAPFDEESLWSYEVGLKSEWLGRRLRLNAALFALDWSDLQIESFRFLTSGDLSSNFEQTINISSARAQGFEIELAARLSEAFTLRGSLGYIDTEIDCACQAELSGGFQVDLEGLDIPKAPKRTAHLAGEYRRHLDAGTVHVVVEAVHRDGQFSDIEALTWRQTRGRLTPNSGGGAFVPPSADGFPFATPAYDLLHLRGGFFRDSRGWGGWELQLFIDNVLDEEYFTGTQENFGLSGIRLRPHPRTFSTRWTWHF
jgi:iron complex outermembrane receptor protein